MKNIIIFVIAVGIAIFTAKAIKDGASKKPDNAATKYADNLKRSEEKAQESVDTAKIEMIRRTISSFDSANGRLPDSLEELVEKGYISSVPAGLKYDSSTGAVSY